MIRRHSTESKPHTSINHFGPQPQSFAFKCSYHYFIKNTQNVVQSPYYSPDDSGPTFHNIHSVTFLLVYVIVIDLHIAAGNFKKRNVRLFYSTGSWRIYTSHFIFGKCCFGILNAFSMSNFEMIFRIIALLLLHCCYYRGVFLKFTFHNNFINLITFPCLANLPDSWHLSRIVHIVTSSIHFQCW